MISHQVEQQLLTLATANHCGAGTIRLERGNRALQCRIKSVERLACEMEFCRLFSNAFSELRMRQLELLSEEVTERLTYLEERVVLVEKDNLQECVQLRSEEPFVNEDVKAYFEIMVGRQGLSLHRYEKRPATPRTPVSTVLSKSLFQRLCSDLLQLELP